MYMCLELNTGLDNLSEGSSLEKADFPPSAGINWLVVSLHLGVELCEIFLMHVGTSMRSSLRRPCLGNHVAYCLYSMGASWEAIFTIYF